MRGITICAAVGLALAGATLATGADAKHWGGHDNGLHRGWYNGGGHHGWGGGYGYGGGWHHGHGWRGGYGWHGPWHRGWGYGRYPRCWTEWRWHRAVRICR